MKIEFRLNTKIIFLVDGLGALLSAFSLFVVLEIFEEYVRMPQAVLNYLAMIALLLSFYSISCFFLLKLRRDIFLRIIGIANLLYSALTLTLLFYFYQILTVIGITYFLLEILIICGLAFLELKTVDNKT